MKRKWPVLKTDEEAEHFVETADLTEYDFSRMVPTRFEFAPKSAALNMRLPAALLDTIKARARAKGLPYSRYIRQVLESAVEHS